MITINAKDCRIKELDSQEYIKFIHQNSLQHKTNWKAQIIYGLFYTNKLVQLMSFTKSITNYDYQWEIIIECTHKNYEIKNGALKLWKHFLFNKKCASCIYYHESESKYNRERITRECPFTTLKHERKGVTPQVDIYYPFGVLYRVDDLTDGSFYIGLSESRYKWEHDYDGSGIRWKKHKEAHPDHIYKRTILKDNFRTPTELRDAEINEINKYVVRKNGTRIIDTKGKLLNLVVKRQVSGYRSSECILCGGKNGHHIKGCEYFIESKACTECGGKSGNHKKICSKYKAPKTCQECGSSYKHKEWCSHAKPANRCPECGGNNKHKKTCSRYKPSKIICAECGGKAGTHKKECSHYKKITICSECGGTSGHHKKSCSRYRGFKYNPNSKYSKVVCKECGTKRGNHKKNCSHYKAPKNCCPICGTPPGGFHKNNCPNNFLADKICPECGGKNLHHKKGCSKYKGFNFNPNRRKSTKICSECGGKAGAHKKICSKYYKKTNNTL